MLLLWSCSLADLLRVNGTAAVLKGGQNYAYVKTTMDPALQLLQPNIVQCPTYDIGAPSSHLIALLVASPLMTENFPAR